MAITIAPAMRPPCPRRLRRLGWDVECELAPATLGNTVTFKTLDRLWRRARPCRTTMDSETSGEQRSSESPLQDASSDGHSRREYASRRILAARCGSRPRLLHDFATALLRTSNNAAVEVMSDATALRSTISTVRAEAWPDYEASLDTPAKRGDFGDPNIFDFLSWVQYTAFDDLLNPETHRDFLDRAFGSQALNYLSKRHDKLIPISLDNAAGALQRLFDCLIQTGYCETARVKTIGPRVVAAFSKPANLAATAAYLEHSLSFLPDIELKIIRAYLSSSNITLTDVETRLEPPRPEVPLGFVHTFTLSQLSAQSRKRSAPCNA